MKLHKLDRRLRRAMRRLKQFLVFVHVVVGLSILTGKELSMIHGVLEVVQPIVDAFA